MTVPKNDDPEAKERKAASLQRKIAQADDGRLAMADYNREHQATLERTAKLKALRLAQEVKPSVLVTPPPKAKRTRKTKAV